MPTMNLIEAEDFVKNVVGITEKEDDFKVYVICVLMNYTRSYFKLRQMTDPDYDKNFIEHWRQKFIYNMIRPKWIDAIYSEYYGEKDWELKFSIKFCMTVLWLQGKVIKADGKTGSVYSLK